MSSLTGAAHRQLGSWSGAGPGQRAASRRRGLPLSRRPPGCSSPACWSQGWLGAVNPPTNVLANPRQLDVVGLLSASSSRVCHSAAHLPLLVPAVAVTSAGAVTLMPIALCASLRWSSRYADRQHRPWTVRQHRRGLCSAPAPVRLRLRLLDGRRAGHHLYVPGPVPGRREVDEPRSRVALALLSSPAWSGASPGDGSPTAGTMTARGSCSSSRSSRPQRS